jgi:hypothetical protein
MELTFQNKGHPVWADKLKSFRHIHLVFSRLRQRQQVGRTIRVRMFARKRAILRIHSPIKVKSKIYNSQLKLAISSTFQAARKIREQAENSTQRWKLYRAVATLRDSYTFCKLYESEMNSSAYHSFTRAVAVN